jgi:hypothetical protein
MKCEKKNFITTFNTAAIVRCVRFRFIFAPLHVLLVNVWDLLYQKYKCLSENNIHSDVQDLQVDDDKYDWRCTLSGILQESRKLLIRQKGYVSYMEKFVPISKAGIYREFKEINFGI